MSAPIPEDLQQLYKLATESSNRGEWCSNYAYSAIRHVERNCDIECHADHGDDGCPGAFGRYDGPYVAAANPNRIQALIERIAALEARNRALRDATEIIYSTTEAIPENHRSPWEDAILRIIDDARAALAATEPKETK